MLAERKVALANIYKLLGEISTPWTRRTNGWALVHAILGASIASFVLLGPFLVIEWAGEDSRPWDISFATSTTDNASLLSKEVEELSLLLSRPCDEACSYLEVLQRVSARDRLIDISQENDASANATAAREAITASREMGQVLRFATGLGLVLLLTAGAAFSQTRAAFRFWASSVWRKLKRDENAEFFLTGTVGIAATPVAVAGMVAMGYPVLGAFFALVIAATILVLRVYPSDDPIPALVVRAPGLHACFAIGGAICASVLIYESMNTNAGEPWSTEWTLLAASTILGILLVLHLAMAAFLSHAAAYSYPSIMKARGLTLAISDGKWQLLKAGANPTSIPSSPKDLDLWDGLLEWQNDEDNASLTNTVVPTSSGMSARACLEIVEDVSRLAMINLVAVLVVVALGTDLLAGAKPSGELAQNAVKEAKTAWLIAVSGTAVLALVYIYVWPAVRLRPYIEAEEALADVKPKSKTGTIRRQIVDPKGQIASVQLPYTEPDTPKDIASLAAKDAAERKLRTATGCTEKKLSVIFGAGRRGGALHELMQSKGGGWLKILGTILAPAFATGIISAFS